ncbi:MAG: 3'(2'),5'-bisphosphate nucleotidase CysQ [Gammaproteobacteria bacterium]|nr:3'(2'),5'-bisphosphate nucleotidase CysQ [Gammaproteobacteria bacterium]
MEINDIWLKELVNPVCEIAKQAGAEIMKIYAEGFEIEQKKDHSPLTTADLASHTLIIEKLEKLTPEIPILSEESASISFAERSSWKNYWLIDPLDGTREFIKRNGEFTVNIALITEHSSSLGVVYIPVQDICYSASRKQGAYKQEQNQMAQKIQVRSSTPTNKPTICGSRSHAGKSLQALQEKIGEFDLISMGSSIKMCLVAEGVADIYPRFGPTSEWDTAAAHCVVNEAGGVIVDTTLKTLQYNTKGSLLNPSFLAVGDLNNQWCEFLSKNVAS